MGETRDLSSIAKLSNNGPIKRDGLRGVLYFVLDEADRMLDMGFMPQVREIIALMGPRLPARQCIMFSATWPPSVHALAREFLKDNPVRISIDQGESDDLCANRSVTQVVEILRESKKDARLLELLRSEGSDGKCLIFVNTKKGAAALAERIRCQGFICGEIHGNLPQVDRAAALADFTNGNTRYLVATDLAARGLDVEDISLVVCYDFPDSMVGGLDDYIHRIGRTGRAGREGRAVTFFPAPEDVSGTRSAGNAHELIKILRGSGQDVPAELIALDNGPLAEKETKQGKGGFGGKGSKKGKRPSPPENPQDRPTKRSRSDHGVSIEGMKEDLDPLLEFGSAPFGRKVLAELAALGFQKPMPIQAYGWPVILQGRDCIGIAKTGSGKTLAFLLPAFKLISKWLKKMESSGDGPFALVVAPTRELAVQIHGEAERFAKALCIRTACAYGGAAWEPQAALLESGVELLVATPGRLAFLMGRGGEAAAALARTIASAGALKQLAQASAAFDDFVAKGSAPTRRIFSAYLNTHVMCGDLKGAAKIAADMVESGFALGVVEHTTLLKGDLAAGNIASARQIIETMLAAVPPVLPDLRTVNTFLRGCLKLGETSSAIEFYERIAEWQVWPDATTYKIIGQLFGQTLRLKDLQSLMQKLESDASYSDALHGLDNAVALNMCIAEMACLIGKTKLAKRALASVEQALSKPLHSQGQIDTLRRQELRLDADRIRRFLSEEENCNLVGCFTRLFPFPVRRHDCKPVEIFETLQCSFGVEQCFNYELCSKDDFESKYLKCFRKNGYLRWPRIFADKSLPNKLEICSGSGDWVVAQAKAESGVANWIASELRYDRIHSIFTKMALAKVDNLGILAGDAGSILQGHIPPQTLSVVCINFPEPPQTNRNASCQEAESNLHLLTADFFRDVHAALIESGVLTIFSDNEEYSRSLASTLGDLHENGARMFAPFADVPAEHELALQENGMLVWQGTPGPEVGHAVVEASQFDRFFQHGQHCDRYYISVLKT